MTKIIESTTSDKPIIIPRNSLERIHLAIREYNGRLFVDARIHYRNEDGEWKPTKKGITVSPEIWPEFIAAVQQLDGQLREQGLVDDVDEDLVEEEVVA